MNYSTTRPDAALPRPGRAREPSRNDDMKTTQRPMRCAGLIAGLLFCASILNAQAQTDVVSIPDPELQIVIRQALNKPTGDITVADMESLTSLDASVQTRGDERPAIASLEGLAVARNLRTLNFASTIWWMGSPDPTVLATTNLTVLSALSNLETLDLSFYALTNESLPAVLSGLTNLQSLTLMFTRLADTSFLTGLTRLRSLDLSETGLTNISPLFGLTNLEVLRLSDNDLADLSFLEGLTALRSLSLAHSYRLVDVSIPSGLGNLRELQLFQMGIRSLTLPDDSTNLQ